MAKQADMTGEVFGRWEVESMAAPNKYGQAMCNCRCSCPLGTRKVVAANALKRGTSKSCGCFRREFSREKATTHGGYRGSAYRVWSGIVDRCLNKNHEHYNDYGGRGVGVCQGCRHFPGFSAAAGPRPSRKHQIDRFPDNNGGYWCGVCEECLANGWPMNLRWATARENSLNKRNNRLITANGETMAVVEWEERTGIGRATLYMRLNSGMSDHDVINTPVGMNRRPLTVNGETMMLEEWARRTGLNAGTIAMRIKSGLSIHDAMNIPVGIASRLVTVNGETMPVAEAARRAGIKSATIIARLSAGMSDEDAVNTPVGISRRPITVNGETMLIAQWAKRTGIGASTIHYRLRRGWSAHDAVTVRVGGKRPLIAPVDS